MIKVTKLPLGVYDHTGVKFQCVMRFTFSHFADAFFQRLTIGEYIKRLILKRLTEEVSLTPSLRHFSNKYKLAREGEKKKVFGKVKSFFFWQINCKIQIYFCVFIRKITLI